ncbi:MAG TPA: hypothetical protein VGF21_04745 [Thermoleophilaceae bacterium]|jgi:hypothetical protein
MPTEPPVPTLFDVVHRAVTACDPEGANEGLAQFLSRFEDSDEPVTAEEHVEETIAENKGAIDPQDEDPAVVMAAAVATYLAFRRDELPEGREELLRLAARAEFHGRPPEPVAGWLAAEGAPL